MAINTSSPVDGGAVMGVAKTFACGTKTADATGAGAGAGLGVLKLYVNSNASANAAENARRRDRASMGRQKLFFSRIHRSADSIWDITRRVNIAPGSPVSSNTVTNLPAKRASSSASRHSWQFAR